MEPNKEPIQIKPKKVSLWSRIKLEFAKKEAFSLNANCHYIYRNNKNKIQLNKNQPCFASWCGSITTEFRLIITQHLVHKNQPLLLEWFNYVLKESIWKDAFIYRKQFLKYGLQVNCNHNKSYIMAALTCLRTGWEYPQQLETWKEFVNQGFTKEEAVVLMNYFQINNQRDSFFYSPSYCFNHGLFSNYFTLKTCKKYCSGKLQYPYKKGKAVNKTADHNFSIWNLTSAPHTVSNISKSILYPLLKIKEGVWGERKHILPKTPESLQQLKDLIRA